jgi:hypothetical protein
MLAPGMTAPEVSATVPTSRALSLCAISKALKPSIDASSRECLEIIAPTVAANQLQDGYGHVKRAINMFTRFLHREDLEGESTVQDRRSRLLTNTSFAA